MFRFDLFSQDPKGVSMEVINGDHNYIATVIAEKKCGPTIQSLIKIFAVFARVEWFKNKFLSSFEQTVEYWRQASAHQAI